MCPEGDLNTHAPIGVIQRRRRECGSREGQGAAVHLQQDSGWAADGTGNYTWVARNEPGDQKLIMWFGGAGSLEICGF